MRLALVFNPGSASLKFDHIELPADQIPGQTIAADAKKLAGASIEEIGKDAKLLVFRGRDVDHIESVDVSDMTGGASVAGQWLRDQKDLAPYMEQLAFVGVHGGPKYAGAARVTD